MNFRVLPAAEGEAIAAAIWYEDRQSGLADNFFTQMRSAFDLIPQNPFSAPKMEYYSGLMRYGGKYCIGSPAPSFTFVVPMKSRLLPSFILADVRWTGWIASTDKRGSMLAA